MHQPQIGCRGTRGGTVYAHLIHERIRAATRGAIAGNELATKHDAIRGHRGAEIAQIDA